MPEKETPPEEIRKNEEVKDTRSRLRKELDMLLDAGAVADTSPIMRVTREDGVTYNVIRTCEEPCSENPLCRLLFELRDKTSRAKKLEILKVLEEADDCDGLVIRPVEPKEPVKTARELRLEKALEIIEAWKDFPATGKFHDNDPEKPMSYGTCFGSNGERDYMRKVAREALKT